MSDVAETRYAKSGDASIAYQVVGDGPRDLLLIPGFVSNVELAWETPAEARFLHRLASFSRLIVFDKRGTGLSDRVPVDQLPSLEARMDDARAVLDAANSERASLLGISEGGPMSVLFAATYPRRTERLVVYGSYARRHDAEPDGGASLVQDIEQHWGTGHVLAGRAASVGSDPAVLARFARDERQCATPGAAAALIRMAAQIDVTGVLSTVTVPTLVLHRTADPSLSVDGARVLARGIPGARLVELPGEDHIAWFGEVDAVLDEIEEFLTGARHEREIDRVLSTVLFTDIVDSTKTAAALGDRRWRVVLDDHDALARREVDQARGRLVKTTGDGILATFDGPARGIRCAEAFRRGAADLGIEVRAGLHTGEVELRGDDIGGIAVHLAARVGARAGAGEILVSRTIVDLVAGSGLEFEPRGEHELKGIPGLWGLFAVV